MTSITQQISNYIGGISQQPDELKVPGQVRTAKNVLPDVTHGLLKRPGGKLVGNAMSAYTTDSKWFHYYRDENEQYIGQIQLSTGEVKMWRCDTGAACTVNYASGQTTALKNYLKQTNSGGTITDSDLQTLTLNDYTYVTNRNKTTAMAATVETVRPPEAYIELKKVAYANQYSVNLFDNTNLTTVKTATRIKVTRLTTSEGCCSTSDGGYPTTGVEPGSSGWTGFCDETAAARRDSLCPNVDTQLFNIDYGGTGDAAQANVVHTNWAWTYTGSGGTDRKDLYIRLTTTGQAVATDGGTGDVYRCRYTTTWDLLHGGTGWQAGDYVDLWMKGAKYRVTIESHSESKVQANLGLIRPEPTSFDAKTTVTAESILGAIRTEIAAQSAFNDADVQQIGNGIYITRASGTFNITTPVGELLNVLSDSVEDVADLPRQCKHGYVIKVANSEAEEDDYYVKFFGANDRDGDGVWEECAKPGVKIALDAATMPIQIVRQADGTFKIEQIAWDNRLVGDTNTVPEPSFIGNSVNKMLFFRNRMVLLSDENVIMSRPGDFYNLWPKSAITYTASDNIDISCSSEYPAIVYDGLQVNSGLVLFTKNQQFMLTTDSDVLSPLTAKINSLSSYNFNFNTNPVSLGTTIAFLDNAGKYTRFFEMQAVLREGEPNVLEQSKNISKLFPNNIDLIANSRENSTIFFATKGTKKIYGFRYYQTGEQRVQQAWFNWELSGDIQHIAMLDDSLYVVVKDTGYTMQKFSIKLDDNSHTIVEDDTYRVHLDNSKTFAYTALTYVADGDYTKLDHTAANFTGSGQLYAVAVSTGTDEEFNGLIEKVSTFDDNGTTKVKIPGNWTTSDTDQAFNVVLGYAFDMEIEFPNFYVVQQEGERFKADIQSSLVLHRIKMSLGPTGVYNTTLKRIGKPDYNELFESVMADAYTANQVGIDKEQVITLPVYEKNTNLTLTLKSTHPSPSTLYSINWEGDYSNRYYKRV
tara:strand:+ start:479 stop:3418 length:2940 start_codon:yes stop_codon:yes gene_type:complete